MSDSTFERAVNDWLDDGADRTPRHAIDGVLLAIKTTPQQRDLRIPWRYPIMSSSAKLAAAAVIVLALGGGAFLAMQKAQPPAVGAPSPGPSLAGSPTPASGSTLDAYQSSRASACGRLRSVLAANTDLLGLYDPNVGGERRTTINGRQRTIATAVRALADELAAIAAPADLAAAHAMDVARQADLAALFQVQTQLLADGHIAEAGSMEQSFEAILELRRAFEQGNGLRACS